MAIRFQVALGALFICQFDSDFLDIFVAAVGNQIVFCKLISVGFHPRHFLLNAKFIPEKNDSYGTQKPIGRETS